MSGNYCKKCKFCGERFMGKGVGSAYCSRECREAVFAKKETLKHHETRRKLVAGTPVMAQPWSVHRYAKGRVVCRVPGEHGGLIRVRLDSGLLYDFPQEHIDIIEVEAEKEVAMS